METLECGHESIIRIIFSTIYRTKYFNRLKYLSLHSPLHFRVLILGSGLPRPVGNIIPLSLHNISHHTRNTH